MGTTVGTVLDPRVHGAGRGCILIRTRDQEADSSVAGLGVFKIKCCCLCCLSPNPSECLTHRIHYIHAGVIASADTSDTRTKSAACAQKQEGVGNQCRSSLGQWVPPGTLKWEAAFTDSAACAQKQAGLGAHCWVTVDSIDVSRKPQMRYMQQIRSLRTKTRGHSSVNECFQEDQNEIHAASLQPTHKNKKSRLGP